MSPITHSRFTFRTLLIYSFIAACAVAFIVYVLFQARFLLAGPQIFLSSVPTASEERLITLEGQAKNIIRMSLNGRQIYTDKNGYFKEALVLENGYTVATLEAQDRYGRITKHTQEFVYTRPGAEDIVINN
jgi:hypothetical protein